MGRAASASAPEVDSAEWKQAYYDYIQEYIADSENRAINEIGIADIHGESVPTLFLWYADPGSGGRIDQALATIQYFQDGKLTDPTGGLEENRYGIGDNFFVNQDTSEYAYERIAEGWRSVHRYNGNLNWEQIYYLDSGYQQPYSPREFIDHGNKTVFYGADNEETKAILEQNNSSPIVSPKQFQDIINSYLDDFQAVDLEENKISFESWRTASPKIAELFNAYDGEDNFTPEALPPEPEKPAVPTRFIDQSEIDSEVARQLHIWVNGDIFTNTSTVNPFENGQLDGAISDESFDNLMLYACGDEDGDSFISRSDLEAFAYELVGNRKAINLDSLKYDPVSDNIMYVMGAGLYNQCLIYGYEDQGNIIKVKCISYTPYMDVRVDDIKGEILINEKEYNMGKGVSIKERAIENFDKFTHKEFEFIREGGNIYLNAYRILP
jgi:hypothetical protein